MDLDQVTPLWLNKSCNKPVELNIGPPGELVKIHVIAM